MKICKQHEDSKICSYFKPQIETSILNINTCFGFRSTTAQQYHPSVSISRSWQHTKPRPLFLGLPQLHYHPPRIGESACVIRQGKVSSRADVAYDRPRDSGTIQRLAELSIYTHVQIIQSCPAIGYLLVSNALTL